MTKKLLIILAIGLRGAVVMGVGIGLAAPDFMSTLKVAGIGFVLFAVVGLFFFGKLPKPLGRQDPGEFTS